MFFYAIQGVWKHLKGRLVWDSWDRQLPASRFCFSMRVPMRHYEEGKLAHWYLLLWYVCIFLYTNTKPLHFGIYFTVFFYNSEKEVWRCSLLMTNC
jgi:hypothetical protein